MAASSGAIRAGRAFVELFADPSKMYRALDGAKKRVEQFRSFTARIGVGAIAIGTAVLTPLAKLFTSAVGEGADIDKLSKRWRMTAESVSTLKGAFSQAGVGAEEFASSMDSFGDKIAAAATANDELIQGLQGLRGIDLLGKTKEEQLDAFADAFKRIVHAEDQVRVASEFGFLPLLENLKKGSAGMRELREAAIANGDAMSGEQAQQAAEINREFNRTLLALKSTLLEVGKSLLPTGASFASFGADVRTALRTAREWIAGHKQVIVIAAAVAAGFIAAGLGLGAMSAAAAVAIPLITLLKMSIVALYAILSPLVSVPGLVAVAVLALAAGLVVLWAQTDEGAAKLSLLGTAFTEFGEFIKSSWTAIGNALKAGDWTLAFRIGIGTADVAWKAFILGLTAAWVGFKAPIVDTWRAITTELKVLWTSLTGWMKAELVGSLRDAIEKYNSLLGNSRVARQFKIDVRGMDTRQSINAQTDNDVKQIRDDAARAQTSAEKERNKSIDDSEKAFVDAALALEDLKRQAADAAKNAGWVPPPTISGPKAPPPTAAAAPSIAALSAHAKGIFGGPAQQSLGYGDSVGQRQLDAQVGIRDNTAQTNTLLQGILDKPGATYKS